MAPEPSLHPGAALGRPDGSHLGGDGAQAARDSQGLDEVFLFFVVGYSVDILWIFCGYSMDFLWMLIGCSLDFGMDFPCCSYCSCCSHSFVAMDGACRH